MTTDGVYQRLLGRIGASRARFAALVRAAPLFFSA
jgi:hypothetical protein